MKDLIERLEKATGPDRELDVLIYFYDPTATEPIKVEKTVEYYGSFSRTAWKCGRGGEWDDCILHFTSSIDAAMTLVPNGWHLHVLNQIDWPGEGWNVNLWGPPVPEGQRQFKKAYAKTPAIALCIAALKARAHKAPD